MSSLHAARLLTMYGFVQEQAALQRILDELQEDITFSCLWRHFSVSGHRCTRIILTLFEEEFDAKICY
ncbi:hypothetical protein ACFS07_26355 [Undibacterium arcticum]